MDELKSQLDRIEKLVREHAVFQKEVLTFKEACRFLDFSESYLYKLTHKKSIPHFCPNNKKLYFKRNDLEEWLLQNRRDSSDEVEQKAANYLLNNPKPY